MNLKKLDPLAEVNIMLGFDCQKDKDLVLNVCLILAKYYMYTCKGNQMQIDFIGYLNKLKQKLTTEEAINFILCVTCVESNIAIMSLKYK